LKWGDIVPRDLIKSLDEILDFYEDYDPSEKKKTLSPWKIIIADDEHEVHAMTKLVLKSFDFNGRGLELLSAYNGVETINLLKANPDVALILLDVVMESETSGLEIVKYIRGALGNRLVRIILRTGQPGQAPEEKVIKEFDINDYRSKTEITVQRLNTSIISSLRAYEDLLAIENNKKALKNTIEVSRELFKISDIHAFAKKIIVNINRIFNGQEGIKAFFLIDSFYKQFITDESLDEMEAKDTYTRHSHIFNKAKENSEVIHDDNVAVMYLMNHLGLEAYLYIYFENGIDPNFIDNLKIFYSNIVVAYDNISLKNEMEETQKEILFTLGDLIENRSKETANHVRRVSEYTYLLAKEYGLDEEQSQKIRMASPMHDIGKIGIPDSILNKPGKLEPNEFEVIKTHTKIGYDILRKSNQRLFTLAAEIAHSHHERWDGLGYPNGLKEHEIEVCSRITAVADVFDALAHKRVYKDGWSLNNILDYFNENKGKMFEPKLVDILFDKIDDIINIKEQFPD
jgi:response regulator RpfG family c-di-GMP phosphodiesterase